MSLTTPKIFDFCRNCYRFRDQHAEDNCLFEPTTFNAATLEEYLGWQRRMSPAWTKEYLCRPPEPEPEDPYDDFADRTP